MERIKIIEKNPIKNYIIETNSNKYIFSSFKDFYNKFCAFTSLKIPIKVSYKY